MWYSCDLPNISDLLQMPQAGIESWAPFKAKVLVLITKKSINSPPPSATPPPDSPGSLEAQRWRCLPHLGG